MKKNIKYIICFTAVLLFSNCKKYLNVVPTEFVSEANVYGNINNALKVWANLYTYLPYEDFTGAPLSGACTDECINHWEDPAEQKYNTGAWGPTDNALGNWATAYQGIRNVNDFLANIDKTPFAASQAAYYTPRIPVYKADARFIRAMLYFELFKRYGAVPLVNRVIDPSDIKGYELPRNSVDEVVNFITSECDAVAPVLPVSYTASPNDVGRVTRGAALALKAKALIFAASPLFNGNALYANIKNADGKALFDASYDKNKWKLAADAAKAVMDMGTYTLYSPTPANPINNYAQLFFTRDYTEVILPYMMPDNTNFEQYYLMNGTDAEGENGYGHMSVISELANAYETNKGYPIDAPGSGYVKTGTWSGTLWDGLNDVPVSNVSNMYKNRDPRFYATIFFQYDVWNYPANPRPIKLAWFGGNGGYASDGWPKDGTNNITGYGWRKWNSPTVDLKVGTGTATRNFPIIRYSEVLLWYAEAMNEYLDAPSADVYAAINQVRNRVSMPKLPVGGIPADLTKDGMRKRIQNEYRIEFAFEGHRFWDVRRWLIAKSVDNGAVHGLNSQPSTDELKATGLDVDSEEAGVAVFYKEVVAQTRVFTDKHYLMPLPQSEIDKDPLLKQNYGW